MMKWQVWQIIGNDDHVIAAFDEGELEKAHALADKLENDGWTGIHVALDVEETDEQYVFESGCSHQKVYENKQLMSNPPQQRWICASCGEEGIDVVGTLNWNQYEAVRKQFGKED